MSEVIRVEGIHKTYRMGDVDVHALRGVNLTIDAGEFVAIMGASGSGKSTFMNIIGCLDHPTSGKYFLEGQEVGSLSRDHWAHIRNKRIGFVFQGFNLLTRTSAVEVLSLVGLGERLDHMPNQLSGGQQQRVAIARALVNRPSLILADEPTGNLDSVTSHEIMTLFQKLNTEQRMTIVLVTHEHDIAEYAERSVVFKDGVIVSDERKVASWDRPVNSDPR